MKKSSTKIVAYIVEDEDTAQYRYRVKNVREALEADGGEWKVMVYRKSELANLVLGEIDLLVILRQTSRDELVPGYVMEARDMGIPVVMDLDDLVFSYSDLMGLMRATGSRNILYWAGYVWGVRRIATKVDGFIATNEFLGEKLSRCFSCPHAVIRNSLNQKQVKIAERSLPKKAHEGFRVGYFSGSPTHAKDFQMVEDELIRFLVSHKDTTLTVVGYMKLSEKMQKLVKAGKVEQKDLVDYEKLQKMMSEVDVNIAPLVVNDFTNCKSELKYFEAAIVETTTIASPTYSYARAIKDGENGYLASFGEWYEKLEYLYERREENEEVARRARKDAVKNYFGEAIAKEAEKAYNELLKVGKSAEKKR